MIEETRLNRIHVKNRNDFSAITLPEFYKMNNTKMVVELSMDSRQNHIATPIRTLHVDHLELDSVGTTPIPYIFLTVGNDMSLTGTILFHIFMDILANPLHTILILTDDTSVAGLCLMSYLMFEENFFNDFVEARQFIHFVYPDIYVPLSCLPSFLMWPFSLPISDDDNQ